MKIVVYVLYLKCELHDFDVCNHVCILSLSSYDNLGYHNYLRRPLFGKCGYRWIGPISEVDIGGFAEKMVPF